MSTTTLSTLIIVALIVVYFIVIYNKLVALKNRFKNAFSQIDVQLQRRYDLIPNLVETAKKYMAHEQQTLTAVIEARNAAMGAAKTTAQHPDDASSVRALSQAETILGGALGKFFALSESYPDLKANTTMNQLMEELSSTENRIAFARQAFNDAVMEYNTYREQFPNTIIASGRFQAAELLEIENSAARQAVKVSFE